MQKNAFAYAVFNIILHELKKKFVNAFYAFLSAACDFLAKSTFTDNNHIS